MKDRWHGLGGLCYELQPGRGLRCRLSLGHRGDHYNWPLKAEWSDRTSAPAPVPELPPAGGADH